MKVSDGDLPRSPRIDAIAEAIPLTQPSERVQAQLFAGILQRQVTEMSEKVARAETQWRRRCEAEGYVDPPERLIIVRERIEEVEKMLNALNARFLRIT
jgi:hypothetical protein